MKKRRDLKADVLVPFVCYGCRRAFKRPPNAMRPRPCPVCGGKAMEMHYRFKTPKLSDKKGWELACFLIDQGFRYHPFTDDLEREVRYPTSMKEAKEWVRKWREKALSKGLEE